MKISLKYGLAAAAVVVVWTVIVRNLMGVGANSTANMVAPVLFNLAQIIAIFLGMIRRQRESGGITFKQGLKTGVGISFVYGAVACLFFAIEYLIVGPKLLMAEAAPVNEPLGRVAAQAFAGLFFVSLILGLFYSTVISFMLAKRLSRLES
jgi:hypothetical protein